MRSRIISAAMVLTSLLVSLTIPQGLTIIEGRLINPDRLLVKPAIGRTVAEIGAVHARCGGRLVRDLPQIGWQIVEVNPEKVMQIRSRYRSSGAIERADFDTAKRVAYTPNDPLWGQEWHLRTIKADLAWDTSLGSSSSVVAIMDTGLQTTHPDLAGNVWTNSGEIAGNGIDDDGNGYVDDVHGYDFHYNDSEPDDQFGHGTACAGIVAAVGDNGVGLSGIAPRARLAGIKAARDDGYFFDSANVPAFLYCADNGINVISMSFFSDQVTPAERDAVDYCWDHNVVLVAAAGNANSSMSYYPGAYDNVIAVAATDGSNNKSWFSNFGTWVAVAAPGQGLTTTTKDSGYTDGFAGTSGACPHVSGAAALLKGAVPSATNDQIRSAIEDTATTLIQAPYGQYTKYGLINCEAALARLQGLTSGSKSAVLQFVAPVGAPAKLQHSPSKFTPTFFGGLGFEAPNSVQLKQNGKPIPYFSRTRRGVAANVMYESNGSVEMLVNGVTKGVIQTDKGSDYVYAATDASTNGSGGPSLEGGFWQLYRNDGNVLTCTKRDGDEIYLELPVRKIAQKTINRLEVQLTRSYANAVGSVESVWLYDWSSWSFPYGPFIQVGSASVGSSGSFSSSYVITDNPTRFLDPEGTIYAIVVCSGVTGSGSVQMDSFRLKIR